MVGSEYVKLGKNPPTGRAYIFHKPTTGWVTTSTYNARLKLPFTMQLGSVAITSDAHTVVIGAPYAKVGSNYYQGEVFMFGHP